MSLRILSAAFLMTSSAHSAEALPGEPFDYNFDGHMDYRVLTLSNGKASQFDVFIYDPALKKHVKDETLSGLAYPLSVAKTKQVFSITTGGHSGALFSGTVYTWNGKGFEFAFSVRQEEVVIDGKSHCIRVLAKMVEGKPLIFSVEPGDREWDEKGMSLK